MLLQEKCIICNHPALEIVRKYDFKKPVKEDYWKNDTFYEKRLWILFHKIIPNTSTVIFQLSHCKNCDFLFLNPRLSDKEIKTKYEYLNDLNSTSIEYSKNPIHFADKRAKRIFNLVSRYVDVSNGKKIVLDYGGQFGHNLKYFSIDKFVKYIIDFERHDLYDDIIYKGSQLENIEDKSCAVVLANHIFEHLNYLNLILENIVRKIEDDGILYIEVPCGVFREAYHIKEPLTHLNYFSEKSLFNLLESAGLSVVHLDTKYQWITVDKEWCINIVGKKKKKIRHEYNGTPQSMKQTKHKITNYFQIILEKIRLYFFKRSYSDL